jgi:hypothetical protein
MLQDGGPNFLPNVGIPICKAKPSHQMVILNNSAVRSSNLETNLIPPDRQSSELEVQHEMMTLNGSKDRPSVKQTTHLSAVLRMMLGLLQPRTLDLQWMLVRLPVLSLYMPSTGVSCRSHTSQPGDCSIGQPRLVASLNIYAETYWNVTLRLIA